MDNGIKNVNVRNIDGTVSLPTGAATSAKQLADNHNVTVSNMIPAVETGLATSAKQLPDGHNVTVDNGAAGSAVNIQDGGNTITVDGSVSAAVTGTVSVSNMIPAVETGLATSAKQLPDGHAVTVDNGSAGDAVNIQDGGNTITVDGSVNANCSGSVSVSNMIPAVETGLATSAKQLADGHNVKVSNQMIPVNFDNIVLTYTGSDLTKAQYKVGAGVVATVDITYDAGHYIQTVTRT